MRSRLGSLRWTKFIGADSRGNLPQRNSARLPCHACLAHAEAGITSEHARQTALARPGDAPLIDHVNRLRAIVGVAHLPHRTGEVGACDFHCLGARSFHARASDPRPQPARRRPPHSGRWKRGAFSLRTRRRFAHLPQPMAPQRCRAISRRFGLSSTCPSERTPARHRTHIVSRAHRGKSAGTAGLRPRLSGSPRLGG